MRVGNSRDHYRMAQRTPRFENRIPNCRQAVGPVRRSEQFGFKNASPVGQRAKTSSARGDLVNFAKVPKKRPKLCAKTIRERDGNRCQYTGKLLRPDRGSLDHVLPRSRGAKDEWGNLVWSDKMVNTKKGHRLPHEAGLKPLTVPRTPKELPVTALIRNAHSIVDWKLFVKD